MSYEQQYKDILDQFVDNWSGTSNIQYEDTPFSKPNPDIDDPTATSWIRLTVLNSGNSTEGYLGVNEKTRSMGIISVQCFTPKGVSSVYGRQLADLVASVFSKKQFGIVICRETRIDQVTTQDAWQQVNALTPFVSNVG